MMIEAAARHVEPVGGHELEDLDHTLFAGNACGKGDRDRLRGRERVAVFEDVVREDPSNTGHRDGRLLHDRNAAADGHDVRLAHHGARVRVAGRDDWFVRKSRLNRIARIGPAGRERDSIVPGVEHHLGDGDGDRAAFLKGRNNRPAGVVEGQRGGTLVAAWTELLGQAAGLVEHVPGGWRLEHEMRLGRSRYQRVDGTKDQSLRQGSLPLTLPGVH